MARKWGRVLGVVTLLLGASLTLFGCGKKAGDSCAASELRCEGSARALECVQGKFAEVGCLGPAGCIEASHRCDRTKAAAGEACEGDWAACSPDGKQFLECKANKLVTTATCSGKQGCFPRGKQLECDQSKANAGDICSGAGTSCTMDGKGMMKCEAGKFTPSGACRGPAGCSESMQRLTCDRSWGLAGDPCEGSGGACEVNGKELLECKGNKLVTAGFCRGQDGCKVIGGSVRCDQGLGLVGDPCDDGAACSVDGTALLHCQKGKLALSRKCKCTASGSLVRCG